MIGTRAHQILWVVVAALALPGIVRWGELAAHPVAFDFVTYYDAAIRLGRPDSRLYILPIDFTTLFYQYPPVFAQSLQPFALMDITQAQNAWIVLNATCTLAAYWFVGNSANRRLGRSEWTQLGVAFILFPPLFRTIRSGEVTCILLFFTALSIWAMQRRRDSLAGAAIAFASAIKIYPAFLIVAYTFFRRVRISASAILVGTILGVTSIITAGWEVNRIFLFEMLPSIAGHINWGGANQSLPAALNRAGIQGILFPNIAALLLVAITLYLSVRASPTDDLFITAMSLVLAIIIPARAWDLNYLILLIPLCLLYLTNQTRSVCIASYGLICIERYWPLMPDHWAFQSFALAGGLLLWTACAWTLWQKPVPHA